MFPWIRYLLSFVLLPLVLPMGRKVRDTIFRMPEASGERKGSVGSGTPELCIISLGESPISGVGLSKQTENFTPLIAQKIYQKSQKNVDWYILGKTGIRMAELLPTFEDQFPEGAGIIFIGMGVNDCKEGTSMLSWKKRWLALHSHLRRLYPSAQIICSSVPPFKSFPALPFPVRTFLSYRSELMNDILEKLVSRLDQKTVFLPLPDFLAPEYFAVDGFHPNAKAHREWGNKIFNTIIQKDNINKLLD